jgi:hypothetical protein
MKNTHDKLSLVSDLLQEVEKYASATEKDFILRKTVPIVLKRIVSPILREIGCGAGILADYFDKITGKERDFQQFLGQIKLLAANFNKCAIKARKLTGNLIDQLEQSARQEEFRSNNFHLCSVDLNTETDNEDEEIVVLSSKNEEKIQTMPGAFPKNKDWAEENEVFYDAVEYQNDEQKVAEEFEVIAATPQQKAVVEVKTKNPLFPANKIKSFSS